MIEALTLHRAARLPHPEDMLRWLLIGQAFYEVSEQPS